MRPFSKTRRPEAHQTFLNYTNFLKRSGPAFSSQFKVCLDKFYLVMVQINRGVPQIYFY